MPSPSRPDSIPGVPAPGELLAGKYRIDRVLGVGGMGVVVAATHVELEQPVAVKFLAPHAPAQPDAVARFVREAKAAIKIKSEHVVRVLDTGKLETGAPYIVMEYLDGCDLHALLEAEGPLAVDAAVDYVLQACDAIAAAHAIGIIHRDLKPGNLFLTRRQDGAPLVKVLDFGISKVVGGDTGGASGLTTTATILGTPAFMPPEQLRSTRHVDERADIWSLGTILFALLTGEPPYAGDSTADIAAKIIRDPPPPLRAVRPDAPPGLEAVILRCLEKDPAARFAGVAELAEALLPFTSEGSRASAERLARQISSRQIGSAPTVASTSKPASSPSSSAETRTASAWGAVKSGEADRRDKRSRVVVASLLTLGAMSVGAALALLVPRGPAIPVAASAPPAPVTAPVPLRVVASPPPSVSPSASASASASPSALASASPSALASASPSALASASAPRSPSPSAKPPSKPPRLARPKPPAPPAPSSSAGLFDDRE